MEGIVKDLISRWESPLGYLHNRGYIKAPAPDFDNLQKELEAKEVKIHEEQNKREVRSYNKVRDANLKDMFQTLFSSKDNGISDELRSKLNVPWDMTALKQTAHNEANRFYEKFYNKRVEEKTVDDAPIDPAQVDKQVARLYPSVVPNAVRKPIEGKKKMRYIPLSYNNNNNKHGDSLVGLAKLLGSREMMDKGRTLPLPIRFERDEFIVPHQGS
ncbi:CG30161 [Drosophila busckii]|uniref:CG30161 n=1 Tax=Drosophila busckii TaxID=30019 RepID=A0A0M4EID4_DROBS|nr:CG30161 [Drosophila busckii]